MEMNTSRIVTTALSVSIAVLALVMVLNSGDMARARTEDWIKVNNPTTPGGVVKSVAISPSNPDRLYTMLSGLSGSRLFRSDNAALDWQPVYTFTVGLDELGVDSVNPDIVYAGGLDGLYRSLDAGLSWTQTYTVGEVFAVISPTLIYAGGQIAPPDETCYQGYRGVARSLDGGSHWQMTPLGCTGSMDVIAVDPGNPGKLYIGVSEYGYESVALLYSDNGGMSWTQKSLIGFPAWSFYDLLIDPVNTSRLYASSTFSGFYISSDGGDTWQHVADLPSSLYKFARSGSSLYAIPAWSLGSAAIYRSDDGGQSWWVSLNSLPTYVQDVVPDPVQPGVLYAGLYGYGIYKTVDGGSIWIEQNNGIRSPVVSVVDLTRSPNNPNAMYAAADRPRGGVFYSENMGLTWKEILSDTVIQAVEVSISYPTRLFAGGEGGVYESPDGGLEWHPWALNPSVGDVLIRAIDEAPGSQLVVYAIGDINPHSHPPQEAVFKRNQYDSWDLLASFPDIYLLNSMAINPQNPSIIYVGGASYSEKRGTVYRSLDSGANWTEVLSGTLESIFCLVIDPRRPDHIYAGSFYGVYFSPDGSENWEFMRSGMTSDGSTVNALVVDIYGVPYAGTDDGVYRWDAKQLEWTPIGLQGRRVFAMEITAGNPQALLASTQESLWRQDLTMVNQTWLPVAIK